MITSPLVPWNTCGIYCSGILGVATLSYLPYAFLGLFLPLLLIVLSLGISLLRAKKPSHPSMQRQAR